MRQSKYEPLVDQVHLLEANPQYAHIRYPNGRESTVSLRHLAPVSTFEPNEHCPIQPTVIPPSINEECHKNEASNQPAIIEASWPQPILNETLQVETAKDNALASKPPLRRSPRLASKQAAEAAE